MLENPQLPGSWGTFVGLMTTNRGADWRLSANEISFIQKAFARNSSSGGRFHFLAGPTRRARAAVGKMARDLVQHYCRSLVCNGG